MSGLHASTGNMSANGRETVANSEYFLDEVNSLGKNVEDLMTIWKGLSANEFNNSFAEQRQNLNEFAHLLNDLGEAITKGANILNDTEEGNASAGSHLFG